MKKILGSLALVATGVVLKVVSDKYGVTDVVVAKAKKCAASAQEYLQNLVKAEENPAE